MTLSEKDFKLFKKWLTGHLKFGPVTLTFTKKDGSEREMNCTLAEAVIVPHEKTTDRVKEENLDTLAVWDLDKEAWRSFRLDSVISVKFDL